MVASPSGDALVAPDIANERPTAPSVALVGTSFRTATVDVRELVSKRLAGLRWVEPRVEGQGASEIAALETCNRIELYFVSKDPDGVARILVERLGGGRASAGNFYVETGIGAIRHIFRVASGLDSPVLGEEQILDQVRDAGRTARTAGQARSILSSLFDAAYSSGRRVRGSYAAPSSDRSVSALALGHALKELGGRPSGVLLIGSGETAKLAALKLKGSMVYLLSARRGVEAKFPNAVRIPRRRLREVASRCDLIIAATRRRGYALTKRDVPKARKKVILDLGFPRNVDPSVASKSIRLYDLDAIARWAVSQRRRGNRRAERLIEKEAASFDAWLTASRLTPTLASIYRWAEGIREEETLAALRRLPRLGAHDRTVVEALGKRLTGKLLSPHAAFVKEVDTKEDQAERLLLLESIFGGGAR